MARYRNLRLSSVNVGDLLTTDDGFTCVPPECVVEIHKDGDGLYFDCDQGRHGLDGQETDDGFVLGLTLLAPPADQTEQAHA